MNSLQIGLVLLFSVSGATCLTMLTRVSQVPGKDVRQGLAGLLLFSGLWAASELGLLLFSSPAVLKAIYIFGLVVGLPTVGAWLYFCSAYTGHDYHRQPAIRWLAVGLYLFIVAVKITNSYHGLYFSSTMASEPFPHLSIQLLTAHWVVTGFSYAITAVGFYLLYELFSQTNLDTSALSALVLLTGLPAALDILSYTGQLLFTLNYEPVGVAVFAIGALYVVDDTFVALPAFWRQEVLEALNDPVIVYDREGRVRDYNRATSEYFPKIEQTVDQPLEAAYPDLAMELARGTNLVKTEYEGGPRYFAVEREMLTIEDDEFGRAVILSDITDLEQQRQELQRQNDQFGDLAVVVAHELRNTLTVIRGYMDSVAPAGVNEQPDALSDSYERGMDAVDRLEQITTDLAKLAQYGQTLQDKETCDTQTVIEQGWNAAGTDRMSLSIECGKPLYGEKTRLIELFSNVFRFMHAIGATTVSVSMENSELVIRNDGDSLTSEEIASALSYGEAVPSAETGMLLPMAQAITRAHGWEMQVEQTDSGGPSLRIEMV